MAQLQSAMVKPRDKNFNKNTQIVMWELTRACQLHCVHCRAKAQTRRDPDELTTDQAKRVIDQIAEMDHPLIVFTGGDPLERPDLFDLIDYAVAKGHRVSLATSVTPNLTRSVIQRAVASGVSQFAVSLDGATSQTHDRFRSVHGSFKQTMSALQNLQESDLSVQINTTVTAWNETELEGIADIAEQYQINLWSLFFLIPTGRGRASMMLDAEQNERVLNWLSEQSKFRPFAVKTTEAPFYRRILSQNRQQLTGRNITDGDGFIFLSHTGHVYPSGFLPLSVGHVTRTSLATLYRESPLLLSLRNRELRKGKCGVCEFREICGGSRARAFAATGDPLESDPGCSYIPHILRKSDGMKESRT